MVMDVYLVYKIGDREHTRRSADGAEIYALECFGINLGTRYSKKDVQRLDCPDVDRAGRRQAIGVRDALLGEMHRQRVDAFLLEVVHHQMHLS